MKNQNLMQEKNLWVFKCNLCQLERFTQNSIETHVEIFHKGMCKICSAYFPEFEDLAEHANEKHCNEENSSSDKHLQKTPWVFKCKKCTYISSKKAGIISHMAVNHNLILYDDKDPLKTLMDSENNFNLPDYSSEDSSDNTQNTGDIF